METTQTEIDWIGIINYIASSMSDRYRFLSEDDVRSAANEGCLLAARGFDPNKGQNITKHIKIKGYFKTIDILRREKWLNRPGKTHYEIKTYNEFHERELVDGLKTTVEHINLDETCIQSKSYENFDNFWFELTDGLGAFYTKVLYLRYIENRTIFEMMEIMETTNKYIKQYIYDARKRLCRLHGLSEDELQLTTRTTSRVR
jgi:DNA-directed RNA polymerase specialized sigma subunit